MNDTNQPETPPETITIPSPPKAKKSRGRPFQLGNTMGKGRPKGSPNKTSALVKELLAEHAEELTARLIQLAKKGHFGALKLAMGILCPTQSEEPVTWTMPLIKNSGDLVPAYSSLLEAATTKGELTPRQAQGIKSILDSMAAAFKNKLGPPIKHIIEFQYVDPLHQDPEGSPKSAASVDTSDKAA
jgi:hypothetical protein